MTLNDAYQLLTWISVWVQNAYILNRTSIHIMSRKKSSKKHLLLGFEYKFQEKWDISIVADTLAPHKINAPFLRKVTIMHAHDYSLTDII